MNPFENKTISKLGCTSSHIHNLRSRKYVLSFHGFIETHIAHLREQKFKVGAQLQRANVAIVNFLMPF